MSKQGNKTRTPMTRKQNNYGNSSDYRATPVRLLPELGEMEAWDLQWAEQQLQEERQCQEDNKNYLEN